MSHNRWDYLMKENMAKPSARPQMVSSTGGSRQEAPCSGWPLKSTYSAFLQERRQVLVTSRQCYNGNEPTSAGEHCTDGTAMCNGSAMGNGGYGCDSDGSGCNSLWTSNCVPGRKRYNKRMGANFPQPMQVYTPQGDGLLPTPKIPPLMPATMGQNTPMIRVTPTNKMAAIGVVPTPKMTAIGATPTPKSTGLVVSPTLKMTAIGVIATPKMTAIGVTPSQKMTAIGVSPSPNVTAIGVSPTQKMTALGLTPTPKMAAIGVIPTQKMNAIGVTPTQRMTAIEVTPTQKMTAIGVTSTQKMTAIGVTPTQKMTVIGVTPTQKMTAIGVTPTPRMTAIGVNNTQKMTVISVGLTSETVLYTAEDRTNGESVIPRPIQVTISGEKRHHEFPPNGWVLSTLKDNAARAQSSNTTWEALVLGVPLDVTTNVLKEQHPKIMQAVRLTCWDAVSHTFMLDTSIRITWDGMDVPHKLFIKDLGTFSIQRSSVSKKKIVGLDVGTKDETTTAKHKTRSRKDQKKTAVSDNIASVITKQQKGDKNQVKTNPSYHTAFKKLNPTDGNCCSGTKTETKADIGGHKAASQTKTDIGTRKAEMQITTDIDSRKAESQTIADIDSHKAVSQIKADIDSHKAKSQTKAGIGSHKAESQTKADISSCKALSQTIAHTDGHNAEIQTKEDIGSHTADSQSKAGNGTHKAEIQTTADTNCPKSVSLTKADIDCHKAVSQAIAHTDGHKAEIQAKEEMGSHKVKCQTKAECQTKADIDSLKPEIQIKADIGSLTAEIHTKANLDDHKAEIQTKADAIGGHQSVSNSYNDTNTPSLMDECEDECELDFSNKVLEPNVLLSVSSPLLTTLLMPSITSLSLQQVMAAKHGGNLPDTYSNKTEQNIHGVLNGSCDMTTQTLPRCVSAGSPLPQDYPTDIGLPNDWASTVKDMNKSVDVTKGLMTAMRGITQIAECGRLTQSEALGLVVECVSMILSKSNDTDSSGDMPQDRN